MITKLWTNHFMRICIANMLLFVSLYMLFPVLPLEMADRLGVPVSDTGVMFLFFTLGMFLVGPFHAYLVDAYKRKNICMYSFAIMLAATAGYAFVSNMTELLLLSMAQGVAFSIATTAGITLAIDVTNPTKRSAGNAGFSWMVRLGMIIGVVLGIGLFYFGEGLSNVMQFKNILYASVAVAALGILFVSGVYVPFRAPIMTKVYSLDRFLLPRGWIPALNLILLAFVCGLIISLSHPFLNSTSISGLTLPIPFFAMVACGFLLSLPIKRLLFKGDKTFRIMLAGALLILVSMLILAPETLIIAAVLFGLGLGHIAPEFLMMLVKLSQHCQRGTANNTHLLSWEVGVALGIAAACNLDTDSLLLTAKITAILILLFFALITYPYYRKMKIR